MANGAWPAELLAALQDEPASGVSVLLDPDDLLLVPRDLGEVHRVTSVGELRHAYEAVGRRRPAPDGRVLLHVVARVLRSTRDIPWDIEGQSRVTEVRFPADRRWIPLYRALDDPLRARLASRLAAVRDPGQTDVLRELYGVVLPAGDAQEFDAVARLRLSHDVPPEAWGLVREVLHHDLAKALASDPPQTAVVQSAWADWLARGDASPQAAVLTASGPAIVALLTFGYLSPVPRTATALPDWTAIGTSDADPRARIRMLLDAKPAELSASTLDGWEQIATWWATLRAAIADAPPASRDDAATAWGLWDQIDNAWVPWLTANLGFLHSSARPVPPTVSRIAPFLARRMRAGSKRICLIVMDGMGFAQWAVIRDHLALSVAETHGVAAVVPTLTPYSRQAIFAGAQPIGFADSMSNNGKESARWTAFWEGEGISKSRIAYFSTAGAAAKDVPGLSGADIVGIAVLAVDDLMHASYLLGDPQFSGALRLWLNHGFLATLIADATAAGFEVWLTSDHGNVQATAIDYLPMEGLAVDRTGERVRLYATKTLREAARADGILYEPPGLPESGPYPLFAPGRDAYVRGTNPVVVHGGLSLDEVLVPLARIQS